MLIWSNIAYKLMSAIIIIVMQNANKGLDEIECPGTRGRSSNEKFFVLYFAGM